MTTLLKIELRKNLTYPTFWILAGFYLVFLFLVVYAFQGMNWQSANPETGALEDVSMGFFAFPMVWRTVGYIAGYMGLFLAILIIINITNEFSFRTLRQSIINGQSREEFFFFKLGLVLIISIVATLWVFGTSLIIGGMNSGSEITPMFTDVHWISAVFMQVFGYLSLAVFASVLLRNSGLTVFLYLAYVIIIERIFWLLPDNIDRFLPAQSLSTLIPFPFPDQAIPPEGQAGGFPMLPDQNFSGVEMVIAFVWIVGFWGLSYWLIRRRDL